MKAFQISLLVITMMVLGSVVHAADPSILADLADSNVAVERLDTQEMDKIRGAGVNQSGFKTYYVQQLPFGLATDYRSYKHVGTGRAPQGRLEIYDGVEAYRHEEGYATTGSGGPNFLEKTVLWTSKDGGPVDISPAYQLDTQRTIYKWNRPAQTIKW